MDWVRKGGQRAGQAMELTGPPVMRSKKLEGLGEVSIIAVFMTWEKES